jgi:SAM-dependent methyltransferase
MLEFDFLAQHYNAMTGFPGRIGVVKEAIGPWVTEWNVAKALDAGCGGGVLLLALDECGVTPVGLDLSAPMLQLARDNAKDHGKTFDLREASFEAAGQLFPETFDGVFSLGNSLVGATDDREMVRWLTGLRDSLRHGGRLLLQILNLTPFKLGLKTLIARRTTPDGEYVRVATPTSDGITFCVLYLGPDKKTDVRFSNWGLWEADRLSGCIQEAGFDEIEVFGSLKKAAFDASASSDLVIAARRP